ncbi:MAG TPA: hypothetical protein VL961_00465 [Acidimicrobiales bacterium]|nr:hypothetical protein [Acidimicrobiales bacterium]
MRPRRSGRGGQAASAVGAGMAVVALTVVLPAALGVPTGAAAAVPAGQDHACIVGSPPRHGVDWGALRNPLLSYRAHGVKDQALQWSGGQWHMLFSYLSRTGAPPHVEFDVAMADSRDLVHWDPPRIIAKDAASPDIVRDPDGRFVITYQTSPDGGLGSSQLEYRVASGPNLASWSAPRPLGAHLAPRMIDGALAFTGHGVILGFKAGTTSQHFEIAWAPSLTSPFHVVGLPDITLYNDTVENYEFLTVDGSWHLVATSNTLDEPYIFTIGPGDPATPSTWLRWVQAEQLEIPDQPFDTAAGITSVNFEHANSAFLCVGPGGVDYLTFAASTELSAFGGWGHARIGIARSSDLVHWQVPPQ